MTSIVGKVFCVKCNKEKVAYKCEGCSQTYCLIHLNEHHQSLIQQLDQTNDKRNLFQQTLLEQMTNLSNHTLIEQVNQWEKNSIQSIQQAADRARELIMKQIEEHYHQVKVKLDKLTEQLKHIRQEEDFNEIHLNELKAKLEILEKALNQSANISFEKDPSLAFLNKNITDLISLSVYHLSPSNVHHDFKWTSNGITVAGGNRQGSNANQLSSPWGVYIGDDQTIYVADYANDRIVRWEKCGRIGKVVAGSVNDRLNKPVQVLVDKQTDSLIICDSGNQRIVRWSGQNSTNVETIISNIVCCAVAMDKYGTIYVSDYQKHEIRRWIIGDKNGLLVAGGNGQGDRLDQLDQPFFICIDQDQSVYVSDYGNHRVMKWTKDAKEGVIVAGGHGPGYALTQLSNPRGIAVDRSNSIYVADCSNHRIVCWPQGAHEGHVVAGGNGQGRQANQLNNPLGISFDQENNLYAVDYGNHRIQKFAILTSNA